MDWQYLGMIAAGERPLHAYSYPSMAIAGEDLLVVSRSGDDRADSAHNTNLITFHRIWDFRAIL